MPKVKISEYSATANSNTDVASINIDEGCAPSGINNAIRAVMGHLKDFQQGTNGDPFNGPVNGTVGATTPSTGAFTTLSATGNVTLGDASTDTLNVGNGGLIKDASGNLGLGVTPNTGWSSAKTFQIGDRTNFWNISNNSYFSTNTYFDGTNTKYIANSFATMYSQQNDGAHKFYVAPSGTANVAFTFTQAMTLDASGNLGIGTSSPSQKLDVFSGTASSAVAQFTGVNTGRGLKISTALVNSVNDAGVILDAQQASGVLMLATGGTERARIDASGNLLVGTTGLGTIGSSSGSTITASGAIYSASTGESIFSRRSSDGDVILFRRDTTGVGNINVTTIATTFNSLSDYRLKNITGALTGAKDFIMSLQPKQGTWKTDGSKFVGFLAHEFQEVSPSSVTGEKDAVDADGKPIMQSMQASSAEVMANLVAFVQELKAEFDAYKASHP